MTAMTTLPLRRLGTNGPLVPRIGLGFVNQGGGVYGPGEPEEKRMEFMDAAFARGETFWDTADEYRESEETIGKWFARNPEKRKDICLATKFAVRKKESEGVGIRGFYADSSPEWCKEAIGRSLERLGLSSVDIYYCHRLDKKTPIERTIEAMVQLKNEGKIKYLGLSECSAASLRRAHAVHPITAVQVEYSSICLAIETPHVGLLKTARELGVAIVAYSPLGNGLLTGTIRTREDFTGPGDLRAALPWLKEENLTRNLAVMDKFTNFAKSRNVTPAQLSLAWLLGQGDDIFPIPGTTKIHRLDENLGGAFISLTADEEKAIRDVTQEVAGGRVQDLSGYAFADTPQL